MKRSVATFPTTVRNLKHLRRREFHETHVRSGRVGVGSHSHATLVSRRQRQWGSRRPLLARSTAGPERKETAKGMWLPMLAESFTNTDADGHTSGKANLFSNLRGGRGQNWISDVMVTGYGDAAVASAVERERR